MKFLYGRNFETRYIAISEIIPENTSVTEVCAGDGYLYEYYLKKKNIKYIGLDVNPVFVNAARKKNISFFLHDLMMDDVPSADYVIIHASLYQFIPNEHVIIKKLLNAAATTLIISEPVRNLSDSTNPVIAAFAKYSANPGNAHAVKRFNKETLIACFKQYPEFKKVKAIKGGRELIGIFTK
ncbi:MAG: class I SAM-dependent methyltransferase [Bacteroidota bacterium]